MKMRIALSILVAAVLVLPMGLAAVAKPLPSAVLEYFENPVTVTNDKNQQVTAKEGMKLGILWTVKTGKGGEAEVKLPHNKSIIKISPNTTFTVSDLGGTAAKPDVLTVAAGKIRMVAGKAKGDEGYRVQGGNAVCGVRGTDFIFTVPEDGSDALLQVLEGLVDFWKQTNPGNILQVGAQMMANFQKFALEQIPPGTLESLPAENEFKKLDPRTVPGSKASEVVEEVVAKVMKVLGVEIGAIAIEGETWSKLVAQPNFELGSLKIGLYLPLIYNGNIFDPDDWYHPNGNDEWSFGTDQSGVLDVVVDVVSDTVLKIKYFEWNTDRTRYFRIGNLNDITIGHGLIMRDFANDADFPAIRRVGLNMGFDLGRFGFEYMVNDAGNLLTLPAVFSDPAFVPDVLTGGRVYFQPLSNEKKPEVKTPKELAFGVSLLADLGASAGFDDPVKAGEPIFLNPGIDIDIPIVETAKAFSIVAFADAALMVPYFRYAPDLAYLGLSGDPVVAGLAWQAVYNPDAVAGELPFKNYGVAAGLFGNLWFIDWRLEYRHYTGVFKPAFYNSGYERSRSQYVTEVVDYLANMDDPRFNALTMGVYGEGGFHWKELAQLEIGYFWPWDPSNTIPFADMEDRLIAKFSFQEIPVIRLSGSFSYERTGFAQTIIGGGGATLFDADTVVKAELAYPLVKDVLDVVLFYTTTPLLGPDGNPVYVGSTWLPEMSTNLTVETRIRF